MPMTLPPPNDDRETLSALFDGELRGDAARFALKRLDHDRAWSESVSRWQLAGDVLRGRGDAAAPAGFAARVGSALAAEARLDAMPAAAAGAGASRRTLGGWMPGAALAASVAVAGRLNAAVIVVVCLAGMGSEVGNTIGMGSVPERRPVTGSTG